MMDANNSARKTLAPVVLVFVAAFSTSSSAQHLGASGNTKVNNAKAQAWARSDTKSGQQDPALQKRVINVGSKRGGDCTVNVGAVQSGRGGRQPKDIVVTTKEVINVCK